MKMRAQASTVVPGIDLSSVDTSELTVGFEFEFSSPLSYRRIANRMKSVHPEWPIGMVTEEYAGHHKLPKATRYKAWNITFDSTIGADSSSEHGVELVSPVFRMRDVPRLLPEVLDFIKSELSGRTDETCGLHVTFGSPKINKTLTNFDPIKLGILLREDKFLGSFGRASNDYCSNFTRFVLKEMREEMTNFTYLRTVVDESNDDGNPNTRSSTMINALPSKGTGPKLTKKNFSDIVLSQKFRYRLSGWSHYFNVSLTKTPNHLVELRAMGGDYLQRSSDELVGRVVHMARCVAASLDADAFSQQYLLALRRMLVEYGGSGSPPSPIGKSSMGGDIRAEYNTPDGVDIFAAIATSSRGHLFGHQSSGKIAYLKYYIPRGFDILYSVYLDGTTQLSLTGIGNDTITDDDLIRKAVMILDDFVDLAKGKRAAPPQLLRSMRTVQQFKDFVKTFPKLAKVSVSKSDLNRCLRSIRSHILQESSWYEYLSNMIQELGSTRK